MLRFFLYICIKFSFIIDIPCTHACIHAHTHDAHTHVPQGFRPSFWDNKRGPKLNSRIKTSAEWKTIIHKGQEQGCWAIVTNIVISKYFLRHWLILNIQCKVNQEKKNPSPILLLVSLPIRVVVDIMKYSLVKIVLFTRVTKFGLYFYLVIAFSSCFT